MKMGGASPVASPQWAKRRHGLATALIIDSSEEFVGELRFGQFAK
jgi:hypothetical protein